jgi:hypothetical protein
MTDVSELQWSPAELLGSQLQGSSSSCCLQSTITAAGAGYQAWGYSSSLLTVLFDKHDVSVLMMLGVKAVLLGIGQYMRTTWQYMRTSDHLTQTLERHELLSGCHLPCSIDL